MTVIQAPKRSGRKARPTILLTGCLAVSFLGAALIVFVSRYDAPPSSLPSADKSANSLRDAPKPSMMSTTAREQPAVSSVTRPVVEGVPTGSYPYKDTAACAGLTNQGHSEHQCSIHYPLVIDKQGNLRSDDSNSLSSQSDFYIVTRKGDKDGVYPMPLPNQDRLVMLNPVTVSTDREESASDSVFVMLADGHGEFGHDCADVASKELPSRFLNAVTDSLPTADDTETAIRDALRNAFLQTDAGPLEPFAEAGTTAIAMFKHKSKVYLASTGDSTALVGRYSKDHIVSIEKQAVHHKPSDSDERVRIEAAGGMVIVPADPSLTSRVVIGMSALAMSRSLGDTEGKRAGYLTAEPSVQVLDLSEYDEADTFFLLAATDGVVDFLDLKEIVQAIGHAMYGPPGKETSNLPNTVKRIMENASQQWFARTSGTYRDDMSLAVTKIRR
jgi:serine/threonine protein phosphatase PrpC